jgi:hypothetical protein
MGEKLRRLMARVARVYFALQQSSLVFFVMYNARQARADMV